MSKLQTILLTLAISFTVFAIVLISSPQTLPFSGVNYGSEYIATSTKKSTDGTNNIASYTVIPECTQALGSVVITGANTGVVNIYNATTTGAHSDYATTSSLLATIPASTAAGTYVFDARATRGGLVFELASGNMPTTTITCR